MSDDLLPAIISGYLADPTLRAMSQLASQWSVCDGFEPVGTRQNAEFLSRSGALWSWFTDEERAAGATLDLKPDSSPFRLLLVSAIQQRGLATVTVEFRMYHAARLLDGWQP